MSNPFDTSAQAVSATAGGFRTNRPDIERPTNKYGALVNSVANVAGWRIQHDDARQAKLDQQNGAIDIISGNIEVKDLQDHQYSTQAYRAGAKAAVHQTESTKLLTNMVDYLSTDEGRQTAPEDFKGVFKDSISKVNTGDADMDTLIRAGMLNQYEDLAKMNAKGYREWVEEDNYNKNAGRASEGLEFVRTMHATSDFTFAEDYPVHIASVLDKVVESTASDDSLRGILAHVTDQAYRDDDGAMSEAIDAYRLEHDIQLTPKQTAAVENSRRAYEARVEKERNKTTVLQEGMNKLVQGVPSSMKPDEMQAVADYQLQATVQATLSEQERGEEVSMEEALTETRSDLAKEGIYDKVYGTQQASNLASDYYVGDKLTVHEQNSNNRKLLAVEEMTRFAENVDWDSNALEEVFGRKGVLNLLEIATAQGSGYRDIETVLTDQTRLREAKLGKTLGGSNRAPVDVKLTDEAITAVMESNWVGNAFRSITGVGINRPAGANDLTTTKMLMSDLALEIQARNPQLTEQEAANQAGYEVASNSVVMGENEGVLYFKGRNLSKLFGVTSKDEAVDIVTEMVGDQMIDMPEDTNVYYTFSPIHNAVIAEVTTAGVLDTKEIRIPLKDISAKVENDRKQQQLDSDRLAAIHDVKAPLRENHRTMDFNTRREMVESGEVTQEEMDIASKWYNMSFKEKQAQWAKDLEASKAEELEVEDTTVTPTEDATVTPTEEVTTEVSQITADEGTRKNSQGEHITYMDTTGNLTGGIGHKMTATERAKYPEGTPIPQEVVDAWYEEDTATARADAKSLISTRKLDVPSEVEEILTNMAFNLGKTNLNKFNNMFTALQAKDYDKAADEMIDSRWYTQVGARAERLAARMRKVK